MAKATAVAEEVRRAFRLAEGNDDLPGGDVGNVLASEPRVELDAAARKVVDRVRATLRGMETELTELGYALQGAVGDSSRPDGVRDSVTDLSALRQHMGTVRERIQSRFDAATVDRTDKRDGQ